MEILVVLIKIQREKYLENLNMYMSMWRGIIDWVYIIALTFIESFFFFFLGECVVKKYENYDET